MVLCQSKVDIAQKTQKNSTEYTNTTFVNILMHFYRNNLGICLVNAWSAANHEFDSAILWNKIWANKRMILNFVSSYCILEKTMIGAFICELNSIRLIIGIIKALRLLSR